MGPTLTRLPKALVFIAGATLLAAIGAVAYSSNSARADTTGPVHSSITATPSDTSAVVNWTTDMPATGQVLYGTTTPYTASTTLGSGLMTNHSFALMGLAPSTQYHFQVHATNAVGSTTMSTDQTFMTGSTTSATSTATTTPSTGTATSTATTTPASLTLSSLSGMPGALITAFGTGFGNLESIILSFGGQMSSGTSTSAGAFSIPLIVPSGSGTINVAAVSGTSGMNATTTFTILPLPTTGTSTATSTNDTLASLQDQIHQLLARIATLEQKVASLMSGSGSTGTTTPSGCTTTGGAAVIDQGGASVRLGTNIDFGGRGFGCEESIVISRAGSQVGTAFTNRAGGFSTGSMAVPSTLGAHTYTFRGANTGVTGTATITVIP